MRWIVVTALLATLLTGCTNSAHVEKLVLAALQRTALLSGRFVYEDQSGGVDTVVKGVVGDAYRYDAEIDVNGTPEVQEVVSDDAVADLFLMPNALPLLARRSATGALLAPPADDAAPTATGISVLDALSSGRWVVDASGAPDPLAAASPVGVDPISDARDVFAYVETAVQQAVSVQKYDPESLTPTYKAVDDTFDKPSKGAAITRYDLAPPPIPRKNSLSGGVNQQVPTAAELRRMVIYVQNGLVVRIDEIIDAGWKLNDLKHNYSLTLTGSPQQQASEALAGINAVRVGQGNDSIRARSMDFQLLDPGQSFPVALPTQAVYGPLNLLVNRGAAAAAPTS